ncbi:hypothetical protein [Nocardioides alcanivorans]|nr:hypothetical protein [Nocardioides alcanivorans]
MASPQGSQDPGRSGPDLSRSLVIGLIVVGLLVVLGVMLLIGALTT